MMRPARRYQLPPLISHPLDDEWSIIVPIARTNLDDNPSFETATTGWSGATGAETLTRTTTKQRRGAYSLSITPSAALSDGAQKTWTVTDAVVYAAGVDFWGEAGIPYQFRVVNGSGTRLGYIAFKGEGIWKRYTFIFKASTTTAIVQVLKNSSASTKAFYIDGVQLESCADGVLEATTYIDGDQPGLVPNQYPPAYIWNGTPHASTSSRSGLTRAGGRVVKFKNYGWFLTAIIGLGLATPQNQAMDYAALDGGQDLGTRKPTRQFTLVGQFAGRTYGRLRDNRSNLAALFDRDLISMDQRLKLRYQAMDGCNPIGEAAEVICKYQGGLEGNTDGHFGSAAPITFTQYLPYVLSDGEAGIALDVQDTLASVEDIAQRSAAGVWRILGTGAAGGVVNTVRTSDAGILYAGGSFTSMGGVANTGRIAKWDGSAWTALGTGATTGQVYAIAIAPNGDVYVAGTFTSMGGVADTARIARWDGSAWNALGTGTNGEVDALAFAPNGDLYITGDFTLAGGVAATIRIAKWDGSVWTPLGSGLNAQGLALAIASNSEIYVAGIFTLANGVSVNDIAKWNGTTFVPLGSGLNSFGRALVLGPNGLLYVGGDFTTAGGVAATQIAVWNGTSFAPLGSGFNGSVFGLIVRPNGTVLAVGTFNTAGGVATPDAMALWTGAAWTALDVDLPGATNVFGVDETPAGVITVGGNFTGSAIAAGQTTVNNIGSGHAYPTLKITGPSSGTSRIYQLVNLTTGRAIYLNYTINAGETAVFRFEPDDLSFTSDFVGNLASTILPGSDEANFFLQPGNNIISFLAADSTVTATLQWRAAYLSLDDR